MLQGMAPSPDNAVRHPMTCPAGLELFQHILRVWLVAVAFPAPPDCLVSAGMTPGAFKGSVFRAALFQHIVCLPVTQGACKGRSFIRAGGLKGGMRRVTLLTLI